MVPRSPSYTAGASYCTSGLPRPFQRPLSGDNGAPATLGDARQAFDESRDIGCKLSVTIDDVLILVHFFDPQHIETSLDPREITCQDTFQIVVDWLFFLATSTNLNATLTPEGYAEDALITVTPGGVVELTQVGQRRGCWPF